MGTPFDILSNEFKVLGLIFASEKANISLYQKTIAKRLKGHVSPNTVTQSINRLFDLGLVNAQWTKIDGSRWARVYSVTGEGTSLAESIYSHSKDEFDSLL